MTTPPAAPRMPVLFLGHGSPMNAIEDNEFHRTWQELGERLPRPRAVLCVSAHWETRGVFVTGAAEPETIHDFYGFPQPLFDVRYPAPGSPELAARVIDVLSPGVKDDPGRGLDHGAWSVLRAMYPDADVPVVQLSLDTARRAAFHYDLAGRLAPLRDEGVLILGSGNLVHNLRRFQFRNLAPEDWAIRFDGEVRRLLEARDHAPLIDYTSLGSDAQLAIPTPEHYLPLVYAAALHREDEDLAFVNGVVQSSISMTSVVIGG